MVKPSIPKGKSIFCDYCWAFAPMIVPSDPAEVKAAGVLLQLWGWKQDAAHPGCLICPECVKKHGFVEIIPPEVQF